MPRRPRPPETKRSEHWLRLMVREYPDLLGAAIADAFGWRETVIDWRSPIQDDDYAEYYDQTFLDRLGVVELTMPLEEFWPKSGPRWDGLARTTNGKLILGKDAYLIFIDFANAPDVPKPASREEWQGATRLAHKCLGLKDSKLTRRVATAIVDMKNGNGQPSAGAYALHRAAQM